MKTLTLKYILIAFGITLLVSSCGRSNKIPCPSYWDAKDGETRGTALQKGEDGKVAPEGASVRKSDNGIVRKKRDKRLTNDYYRGKKKK